MVFKVLPKENHSLILCIVLKLIPCLVFLEFVFMLPPKKEIELYL